MSEIPKLRCPSCLQTAGSEVADVRHTGRGDAIVRRRQCRICRYRYDTLETIRPPYPKTPTGSSRAT